MILNQERPQPVDIPPPPSGQAPPPAQQPWNGQWSGAGQPPGWGYAPGYGQPRPDVNGMAIAALVVAALCCVPVVGIILGVIALGQIKTRGQRGRGLAIGGIVLSSVTTVAVVLSIIVGGAGAFDGFESGWRESSSDGSGTGVTADLVRGDCFEVQGGIRENVAAKTRTVSCTSPHDGEVTGVFDLADVGGFPGDSAVSAQAEEKCLPINHDYAVDPWAVPDRTELFYFAPGRQNWQQGDRRVTCTFASESGKLRRSLREQIFNLTDEQAAFLDVEYDVDTTLSAAPDALPDDDLRANRVWAKKVAASLGKARDLLKSDDWTGASAKPVAAVERNMAAARKEWSAAANARDADVFRAHEMRAGKELGWAFGRETRRALGLDTTPWVGAEDDHPAGGSGSGGTSV